MSVRSPWSGSTFFSSRTTDRHEQFYELLRFEIVVLRVPQQSCHWVGGIVIGAKRREDVGVVDQASLINERHCSGSCFSLAKTKESNACGLLCAVRSVRRPKSCGNAFRAFSIAPARFTRGRDSSTTAQEALQVTTPRSPELSHPSALSAGRSRLALQCR